MKYCRKCLATNLRPNTYFNKFGICPACEYAHKSKNHHYQSRLNELFKLIKKNKARRKKHEKYDCIVGISGGKDSTRQALWVRDRLGLTPLLVCCGYPPKQMTNIGAKNLANLIEKGFDIEIFTPAALSSAKLSLASFRNFGNVSKSLEMALFASVPRIAIEKKITMIFWGENPALQVGDLKTLGNNFFDGNNLRNLNTLVDGGVEWIFDMVEPYKANAYVYPSSERFSKANLDIFYLGPAWDDWTSQNNSIFASLNGLSLRPHDADVTGDISGASMLDEEFTNINMMIRRFKFGFGRATDLCNEKIRSGTLTRNEAIKIVEKYDHICDDSIIKKYCNYVNISVSEFWDIVNSYTNKKIFFIQRGSRPIKKFNVGEDFL